MFFFRWNEKKREWQWRLLPLAKVMNNCHFFGTLPFRKAAVAIPIVEHWTMLTFTRDIWHMGRVPCGLTIWHHFYSNKSSKNIPSLHPHPHLVHRCIHDDQHSAVVVTPSTLFTMVSSLVETVEVAQRRWNWKRWRQSWWRRREGTVHFEGGEDLGSPSPNGKSLCPKKLSGMGPPLP